ncbi:MAG: hypothetical protein OEW85_02110 [Acidimicrobiia bacterium]|nr:hypothetical protein [Acidimicrobiia bacterium]
MGLFMNTREQPEQWQSSDSDWSGFSSELGVSDEDFLAAIEAGRRADQPTRPTVPRN